MEEGKKEGRNYILVGCMLQYATLKGKKN